MPLQKRVSELPAVPNVVATDLLIVSSANATKRCTVQQIGAYFQANGVAGPPGPQGPSGASNWSEIAGKPSTFPPSTHTHVIADVTGLQAALDGKQAVGSYAAAVHLHGVSDVTGLQALLDGKQAAGSYAASVHTHGISDVTGLQSAIDGKAASSHTHTIANVTGLQTALDAKATPADVTSAVAAVVNAAPASLDTLKELADALGNDANFASTVTNAIAGKAAAVHTHVIADVTGLQTALDGKQASGSYAASVHTHGISDVTGLQTALDGKQAAGNYAAATHGHSIYDVTGLQTALNGKQAAGSYAAAVHAHGISDVTGLQTALDGKAASTHGHAIADVTGLQTALDGKQAAGSYAAASHGHAIADVTGLQTALDGKAAVSHAHTVTDITGFSAAAAAAAPVQSVNGQTGAVVIASYSLPVATASVLGGVKAGSNVTIDGTGVISVAAPVTSLPYSSITGTPTLAQVATSGSAADLSGTLNAARLPATAVTAGSYGSASSVAAYTVDATGRLTAAGSTAIAISAGAVSGLAAVATSGSYSSLSGIPSTFTPSSHTHTSSSITDFASAVAAASPEEVVEYTTTALFPASGNSTLLYIATDASRAYRWTGSAYVEVGPLASYVTPVPASSVSGLAASATTDTTNASNLSSGTLSASRLPTSGVAAGTYTSVSVDATGRVTAGSNPSDTRWTLFMPPAPTGVIGYSYNGTANVSWSAPSVLSQTPITNYTIQYSGDSGATWTSVSRSASTATSATLTGLPAGSFLFRVSATNDIGTGSYSSASTLKTLDAVSGAALAYSLRNLTTTYTGPVVQLRRSSDSATRDCYETELTDGTVAAWAGGGDAFVRTWYDQSGNARHVQQTTSSLQPQLVSSGTVLLLNGKPAIDWSAATVNKVLTGTVATSTALTTMSVFSAVKRTSAYNKLFNIGPDSVNSGYACSPFVWENAQDWQTNDAVFLYNGFQSGQSARIVSSGAIFTSSATTQALLFASISSSAAKAFVNGTEIAYRVQTPGNASVIASTTLYVGNNDASVQQFNGRMQELIFWTADRLSMRLQAEYSAKGFYGMA